MNEDKQKMDKWWQHEGLDRTHMLLVMLEQSLGFYDPDMELSAGKMHPSIWNQKCQMLLCKATGTLAELYQAIGEWEENNESK